MKLILQPWQLMLQGLAAWVNREQQARIEYRTMSGTMSGTGHVADYFFGLPSR